MPPLFCGVPSLVSEGYFRLIVLSCFPSHFLFDMFFCVWWGVLEHDLFLRPIVHTNPLWVLFFLVGLGSSLFVLSFPHFLGAFYNEI
jgi:hypothetical protein